MYFELVPPRLRIYSLFVPDVSKTVIILFFMTDLVEDENCDVSNNKNLVESKDEDKAIWCKEGRKHEGGHEGKPFSDLYWLRCDIKSWRTWYHDFA